MSYNPFGSMYDIPQAKSKGFKKGRPNNKAPGYTPPGAGKYDKIYSLRIQKLTREEKRLAKDPNTDPADLAEIRRELAQAKADFKRQRMAQNGEFMQNAVLK